MPIEVVPVDARSGVEFFSGAPHAGQPIQVVRLIQHELGVFASTSQTVAGTYVIATPIEGQALVLTDILISAKKKAGSTMTLRFTDGSDTVIVFSPDTVQAEVNFAIPLAGRWVGWEQARFEVVTVADVVFTVSIGYHKVASQEDFTTWDKRR